MKNPIRRFRISSFPVALALAVFVCSATSLTAQNHRADGAAATAPAEEGIPVKNALVQQKCGTCHQADAKGNMSRISYVRTTPEGWEEAIKRMIRLNGLQLSPDEAKQILRYLSDWHGLAPEEAKPVAYFAERRLVDEQPNPALEPACGSCHATAKPLSWRRTAADWQLLKNMHIAYFPNIEGTSFAGNQNRLGQAPINQGGNQRTGPDGKPVRAVDDALAFLAKSAPLHTLEWANWETMIQQPSLAGTWNVSGHAPGKGAFQGKVVIKAGPSAGTFTTETSVKYINGDSFTGTGSSIVYTGYAWRGSTRVQSSLKSLEAPSQVREVMMLSRDGSKLEGRWFWGTYQEFGMNVTLTRDLGAPALTAVSIPSIKAGSSGVKLTVFGAHLPAGLSASSVDLGSGVSVASVESTSDAVQLTVNVDANAVAGKRTITIGGVTLPGALAIYNHIDFLKVTPETSISRLGTDVHAKGYALFEAEAYNFGPDGKAMTADDIALGAVPATWKLEEFVASYGDDDIDFVGTIDSKSGLFTPSSDGPNPKRKSMRNNYGDVWVVASYTPEGQSKPVIGRGYMVVAVPQYVQYDQPEVAGR